MRYPGAILLIAFAGLAVFGVFGMHMDMQQGAANDCLLSTMQIADCGSQATLITHVASHFDALKGFSTAIFMAGVLLTALSFVALVFFMSLPAPGVVSGANSFAYLSLSDIAGLGSRRRLRRWLSLHENSPALR